MMSAALLKFMVIFGKLHVPLHSSAGEESALGGVCSHLTLQNLLDGENLVEMWKTLCSGVRPALPEEDQALVPL